MSPSAVAPDTGAKPEGGPLAPHPAETVPAGEAAAIARITQVSLDLLSSSTRPVARQQHAKSHGLVRGELVVEAGVPSDLRHGLFREPATYPAVVRFSNGQHTDDADPGAHGMAIKLLGVRGPKLLPRERDETTHDFVLMDSPAFFIRDAAEYAEFSELTRMVVLRFLRGPVWLRRAPDPLRKLAMFLRFSRWNRAVARRLKGVRRPAPGSPLAITYHSCTPYALGPHATRFRAVPDAGNGPAAPPAGKRSENFLREAMSAHLENREALFSFEVQRQTVPERQPVEDPTVAWGEEESPFERVATLRIPSQRFDTPAVRVLDESLSFTPWHALEAHRPLGGINRARRVTYEALSARRHALNAVAMVEPTVAVVEAAWNEG